MPSMWNLGEENNTPDPDRKAIAAYIRSLDAYKHPITVHTHNNKALTFYDGILGDPSFEANLHPGRHEELQQRGDRAAQTFRRGRAEVGDFRRRAAARLERCPARRCGPVARSAAYTSALGQSDGGGGSGVEWYFGYSYPNMDINCEDFRSRDRMWDQTRYALDFFRKNLPFAQDRADNQRATGAAYVLAKADEVVAMYLPSGGDTTMRTAAGKYSVQWYNPRTGELSKPAMVRADANPLSPGKPPADPEKDWAILIRRAR